MGVHARCHFVSLRFAFSLSFSLSTSSVYAAQVPGDYVLKEHDKYTYAVHRHEAPVTQVVRCSECDADSPLFPPSQGLTVLYSDDEYLVVNKPGSIPGAAAVRSSACVY